MPTSPNCRVADSRLPRSSSTRSALTRNLDTMTAALPGARLRPHVKAHKCTALAREQASRGHVGLHRARRRASCSAWRAPGSATTCCSPTSRSTTTACRALADCGARVTVAVDSEATVDAAARNGIREVLIDVNVGIPRCGVAADDAGALADLARAAGSPCAARWATKATRCSWPTAPKRAQLTDESMAMLARAHAAVGGDDPLRRRHRHLRRQHDRDRDPGRLVRADGHRVREARHPVRARARASSRP